MSGRSYFTHELTQWAYVALVCIALAFTSIVGAATNLKPSGMGVAPEGQWAACVAQSWEHGGSDKRACEATKDPRELEPVNAVFGSALVNTGLTPWNHPHLIGP